MGPLRIQQQLHPLTQTMSKKGGYASTARDYEDLLFNAVNSNNAIDELSEIQVEMLATGLHTFMRDNKGAIQWLITK